MGISNYVRGGQLQIHQLKMIKQVIVFKIIISVLISSIFFMSLNKNTLNRENIRVITEYVNAFVHNYMVRILPISKSKRVSVTIGPTGGKTTVSAVSVLNSKYHILNKRIVLKKLKNNLIRTTIVFALSFFAIALLWYLYGRSRVKIDILRGAQIVSINQFKRFLQKNYQLSDIKIQKKCSLLKDFETTHTLVSGTTGVGKTTLFKKFLPQIRNRKNKAIILDINGEYSKHYYNPKTDFIFNPYDERSIRWDIFADCREIEHFSELAESLIPNSTSIDDVWDKASRAVFTAVMRKLVSQQDQSIESLVKIMLNSTVKNLESFLKDTIAANIIAESGERTTQSVLMNLTAKMSSLELLTKPKTHFSIRDWIRNENNQESWVFLSVRSDQIASTRTIFSSFLNVAINETLSLDENFNRRIWFVMDELPAISNIPNLESALARARKNGGCILAGIQSIPQLTRIYGRDSCKAMLDLFNNWFVFRCNDWETKQQLSEILGTFEREDIQESTSYGAGEYKDGVSYSKQRRVEPVVLPAEIGVLGKLELYVRYSDIKLVTKIKLKH